MRFLILIAAVAASLAVFSLYVGSNADAGGSKARYCDAPCIVVLPPGTLEDEFWFDYGWHRLRDADGKKRLYPVVGVYTKQ